MNSNDNGNDNNNTNSDTLIRTHHSTSLSQLQSLFSKYRSQLSSFFQRTDSFIALQIFHLCRLAVFVLHAFVLRSLGFHMLMFWLKTRILLPLQQQNKHVPSHHKPDKTPPNH
uniref:Uncharacterized protein n=1 Tax=Glossina brevipalpis TaxID=37001 RepID=A0A1A9WBT5_9MUSC